MGYFISELTYEELTPLLTEDAVVVLPIGGGAKEHGGHLPMGTDFYVTDWVARQVTERRAVLTLPTLPYAYFPAFVRWNGSVSIEHQNFTNYVRDILMSYVRTGVRKFLIIDGGVSTHPPLCLLARDTEEAVCEQKQGGHGDESETSTMLWIREDLVHMDRAVEEYTAFLPGSVVNGRKKVDVPNRMCTPHGTNGNSKLATKEKGQQILEAMVEGICTFLDSYIPWTPEDIR